MAGDLEPLDNQFVIVNEDGTPTLYFMRWAQQRQIDIEESVTAEEVSELIVAYFITHPVTIDWGDINGTLADQTDLQDALDHKVPLDHEDAFAYFLAKGFVSSKAGYGVIGVDPWWDQPDDPGFVYGQSNSGNGWVIGGRTANDRVSAYTFGDLTGFEFQDNPYVGSNVIWNAGNFDPDTKLTVVDNSANWSPGALRTDVPGFSIGDTSTQASVTLYPGPPGDPSASGGLEFDLLGYAGGIWIGDVSAGSRMRLHNYGTITGIEFDDDPYVNNNVIFHAGNLAFGTGLDYTAGVLTATGGSGGVLPVVDGSIPPVFLQNPDGSLIYAPI